MEINDNNQETVDISSEHDDGQVVVKHNLLDLDPVLAATTSYQLGRLERVLDQLNNHSAVEAFNVDFHNPMKTKSEMLPHMNRYYIECMRNGWKQDTTIRNNIFWTPELLTFPSKELIPGNKKLLRIYFSAYQSMENATEHQLKMASSLLLMKNRVSNVLNDLYLMETYDETILGTKEHFKKNVEQWLTTFFVALNAFGPILEAYMKMQDTEIYLVNSERAIDGTRKNNSVQRISFKEFIAAFPSNNYYSRAQIEVEGIIATDRYIKLNLKVKKLFVFVNAA